MDHFGSEVFSEDTTYIEYYTINKDRGHRCNTLYKCQICWDYFELNDMYPDTIYNKNQAGRCRICGHQEYLINKK